MKRTFMLVLMVSALITMTACGEKETVKPYERKSVTPTVETQMPEETTENIATDTDDNLEPSLNKSKNIVESTNETLETLEETTENSEETTENSDETNETMGNDLDNNESIQEEHIESNDEEEYVPNGSISDRSISIGKAYIGKNEFTVDTISEYFSKLGAYETNELTKQVAESTVDYLNNYSEYKLINLWQEYDSLEKHQRYALIILTTYEQSFGGYSKSSMSKTLSNSEYYSTDVKSMDSDLK